MAVALVVVVAVAVGLVILLSLAGLALGLGAGALWWATALYHAFKPEERPSRADSDWYRNQGREAK